VQGQQKKKKEKKRGSKPNDGVVFLIVEDMEANGNTSTTALQSVKSLDKTGTRNKAQRRY
jgi:hypothetical protein